MPGLICQFSTKRQSLVRSNEVCCADYFVRVVMAGRVNAPNLALGASWSVAPVERLGAGPANAAYEQMKRLVCFGRDASVRHKTVLSLMRVVGIGTDLWHYVRLGIPDALCVTALQIPKDGMFDGTC